MNTCEIAQITTAKSTSILKPSLKSSNGKKMEKTVQDSSCVSPTFPLRRDFYGNSISKKKKHTVFFNLSANKVYMVESYKKHNMESSSKDSKCKKRSTPEDIICTVF